MNKLVCIVGPTATGKTAKAIELSKEKPSIIISADSRQVYRGMDIVTGKDHPHGVSIYGIDIVEPDQPISVAVWYDSVMPHINQAWADDKQVILVGGTGLYVKALTNGIETMGVEIDQSLRDGLAPLSITELQARLKALDLPKFESMNASDSFNPRRLIRAIEISLSRVELQRTDLCKITSKMIGLKYFDDSNHRSKIRDRVSARIASGAIDETKSLLERYPQSLQSMSAIGYKSIVKYLKGEYSKDQMIDTWLGDEMAYVKRQMTWFRKQPVIWYDIDKYGNK
ncbi:MAG: tRNA (adenosine(37)-N6)-dimethylallyltransferase MiaA [Microgenomates group bacterium]